MRDGCQAWICLAETRCSLPKASTIAALWCGYIARWVLALRLARERHPEDEREGRRVGPQHSPDG
jgi:urease accessory protein UreF